MTRWIITAVAVGAIAALWAAPGCAATGVGDPCIPDEEYEPTFQAFSYGDVNVESKSYVCLTRLCLVNHFQGRVSCPYGQTSPGVGPTGTSPNAVAVGASHGCTIPGGTPGNAADEVTATNVSVPKPGGGSAVGWVPPQIPGTNAGDRTANKTVYCSCRCANVEGNTNDGDNYCSCPENYTCTQLVTSIGLGANEGLTGAYCVLNGTQYSQGALNGGNACDSTVTDPSEVGSYCALQY
jgi:hypothetical protein